MKSDLIKYTDLNGKKKKELIVIIKNLESKVIEQERMIEKLSEEKCQHTTI